MKHNKFSKLIERLLVCLPLIYIAVSSAYVIFNKNAKDSYYGETINETSYTPLDLTDMILDQEYYFNFNLVPQQSVASDTVDISASDITFVKSATTYTYSSATIRFYVTSAGNLLLQSYDGTSAISGNLSTDMISISFTYLGFRANNATTRTLLNNYLYERDYNQYSFLSNVLPYSMSEFNKLGFGKLDFTSWFTNIFMNGNTNNVYVQFVNSYLNYFLLVEVVYFIPMIIYWFIHFGESVIEKFTNKEF